MAEVTRHIASSNVMVRHVALSMVNRIFWVESASVMKMRRQSKRDNNTRAD
jgi:hypothetical protein